MLYLTMPFLALLGCYNPGQYSGDGHVVSNAWYYQMPFTIWLPEIDLAQTAEHRFTLNRPPPHKSWIQLLFPHSRDALARLTVAGTSIDVELLNAAGDVLLTGGGILPDDKSRLTTPNPHWVLNGGDPDTMWSLATLPRLDSHASYTLILRVSVAHSSANPIICSPRVNSLED